MALGLEIFNWIPPPLRTKRYFSRVLLTSSRSAGKGWLEMDYCPECGGEMQYMISAKHYVCKSCGLLLSHQEILEARERKPEAESAEDQHKRERRDYLKWWLSKKK